MSLIQKSWWLQFKLLSRTPFFMSMAILTPIVYSTIALLLLRQGGRLDATFYIVGSGMMGAWSATLFGAGEALYMQRFSGTLQLIAGSPRRLLWPVVGFSLAAASLGFYSIVAAFGWSIIVFGVPVVVDNWFALVFAVLVALVGLSSLGIVLAAVYVLSRQAMAISNLLEFPIWIVSGLLFPASALWEPLEVIGKFLPVGWGLTAIRGAMFGESYWLELGICGGVSLCYLALGVALLSRVEYAARVTGRLTLR